MSMLKAAVYAGSVVGLGLTAAPAMAGTVWVTNNANDGHGSFRAAVAAASTDPSIDTILFRGNLGTILIDESIVCECEQALTIDGRGTAIEAATPGTVDLFIATDGGDLTLNQLTFRNGLSGIVVEVPADHAGGELAVSLFKVTVAGNEEFGLYVDDTLGSPAGVGLDIALSSFTENGTGDGADCTMEVETPIDEIGDCDAVRINERGEGDITASVNLSRFVDNAADGVELDEDGPGDATLTLQRSRFDDNGLGFLDPAGEGVMVEPDDGVDIDERDEGDIWLRVAKVSLQGNGDDGIGMDESGDGGVHLSLVLVNASRNGDKGVSVDENDAGDFDVKFSLVRADDNFEDGAKLEEIGEGSFVGRAALSSFSNNGDDGLDIEQDPVSPDDGGVLHLHGLKLDGNGDEAIEVDNVEVIDTGGSS